MRKREKPPNPTYGVDLLGCDLRTWTRNVAYQVPLQVPNRGTGTTVLTYHLGFGIELTTEVFGSLFWPLIPAKTRLMIEDLAGPPVVMSADGCMSVPSQTHGVSLLLFVRPLYWTSKLTRVDLMITRTTTKQQTTNISVDLKPKNEVGRREFGENASIFLNSWPQLSWWIQGLDRR